MFKQTKFIVTKNQIGLALLLVWGAGASVLLTLLIAGHNVALAVPPARAATVALSGSLNKASGRWQMLHVLADHCACSQDVIKHLLQRGRSPELGAEGVVLVGHRPDLQASFAAAGFNYTEIAAPAVASATGVEAAPTLVIIDDHDAVRYTGGYYPGYARTAALDLKVLADIRADAPVKPLPVFGCAFSRRLQTAVDPLALKYPSSQSSN